MFFLFVHLNTFQSPYVSWGGVYYHKLPFQRHLSLVLLYGRFIWRRLWPCEVILERVNRRGGARLSRKKYFLLVSSSKRCRVFDQLWLITITWSHRFLLDSPAGTYAWVISAQLSFRVKSWFFIIVPQHYKCGCVINMVELRGHVLLTLANRSLVVLAHERRRRLIIAHSFGM